MKLHKIPIGYNFKNIDIDIFYIDRRKLKKLSRKKYIVPIKKGKRVEYGFNKILTSGYFNMSVFNGKYYCSIFLNNAFIFNEDANTDSSYESTFGTIHLYKIFESKAEYLKWKLKL